MAISWDARFATMETRIGEMEKKQEQICRDNREDHQIIFKKIDANQISMMEKLDKFIKTANDTYATKAEVYKVISIIFTVLTAGVAVFAFIFKFKGG